MATSNAPVPQPVALQSYMYRPTDHDGDRKCGDGDCKGGNGDGDCDDGGGDSGGDSLQEVLVPRAVLEEAFPLVFPLILGGAFKESSEQRILIKDASHEQLKAFVALAHLRCAALRHVEGSSLVCDAFGSVSSGGGGGGSGSSGSGGGSGGGGGHDERPNNPSAFFPHRHAKENIEEKAVTPTATGSSTDMALCLATSLKTACGNRLGEVLVLALPLVHKCK